MNRDADDLARLFARLCAQAARPVMEIYASDFAAGRKPDNSPVTEADRRAEDIILAALARDLPGVTVIAEESFSAGVRPDTGPDAHRDADNEFVLVDPVDGTREFINRNGEFTVNIALVSGGAPVAGCVFAPARGRIYLGGSRALAGPLAAGGDPDRAALTPIKARTPRPGALTAILSRSHGDERASRFARTAGAVETLRAGSSLKFCLIAEGLADLYPRFGPTMEWDTAAGHAVLNGAGGSLLTPEGDSFTYGKVEAGFRNGFFIARGGHEKPRAADQQGPSTRG